MLKNDRWIRKMSKEHDMINPFSEKQVREGVISYGLSSYGYDLRVADEFKIFTNVNSTIVDPKKFDERSFVTMNADSVVSTSSDSTHWPDGLCPNWIFRVKASRIIPRSSPTIRCFGSSNSTPGSSTSTCCVLLSIAISVSTTICSPVSFIW